LSVIPTDERPGGRSRDATYQPPPAGASTSSSAASRSHVAPDERPGCRVPAATCGTFACGIGDYRGSPRRSGTPPATFELATDAEKRYLIATASLGDGPYRTAASAEAAGYGSIGGASATRESLIAKELIWSPRRGFIDFTVPRFASHLRTHDHASSPA